MSKSKKRFVNEQQILAAIDECHEKAAAYTLEANQCEADAAACTKRAYEMEQENIALAAFRPIPTARKAVEAECARWHIGLPILLLHIESFGMNEAHEPFSSLPTETLKWCCENWPIILQRHIGYLRRTAGEKFALAKRRRTGADNQLNQKAVELGKKLAVMRTEPMAFLPETNRAGKKEGDCSIPAAI